MQKSKSKKAKPMSDLMWAAECAKKNLAKDGYILSVFLFYREKKLLEAIPTHNLYGNASLDANETKTVAVFNAGILAKRNGVDKVIMIWDAALRQLTGTKEERENALDDITEAPLTYPKSMRTECLIVHEILLPSGKNKTLVIPYKGGEGKPVLFVKIPEIGDMSESQNRFTEIILKGYRGDL